MFCDEKIIKVYHASVVKAYDEGYEQAELQIMYYLEFHTTEGEWLVFETINRLITVGVDGVVIYDNPKEFLNKDIEVFEFDDVEEGFVSFETRLFVGQHITKVLEEDISTRIYFDNFEMTLYKYHRNMLENFYYTVGYGYSGPVSCGDHLITRECQCGGKGKLHLDSRGDFYVRCEKCHRATYADFYIDEVLHEWNTGAASHFVETGNDLFKYCVKEANVSYVAIYNRGRYERKDNYYKCENIVVSFDNGEMFIVESQRVSKFCEGFSMKPITAYNQELWPDSIVGEILIETAELDEGNRGITLNVDGERYDVKPSCDLCLIITKA